MILSMFNQQLFEFRCQCGKVSEEVLSNLDNAAAFTCPSCGFIANLNTDPWRTHLVGLRDIASELDKQAVQRGETIERIKG